MSRRLRPLPALALAALLTATGLAPAVAEPAPGDEGIGDPYYPLDGNGGYDVAHYDIHDRYRFRSGRLTGTTTVTLTPTEELSSFSLDLLLRATAVTVDGESAAHEKPDRHELVVTPATPLAEGEPVEVTVDYRGVPGEIGWRGERNWLADEREVVTVNQPHMAPWWFPSNDHPSDKATFEIAITVPAGKQVVSNGERLGRTARGRLATTRWRVDAPMATYLAFFAAGDYAVERGTAGAIPWYNAVSRQLGKRGVERALRELRPSGRITRWLQRELGPYPFRDTGGTGGLVTPLARAFALENQTRPVYGRWIYRGVVVHELAHQWFGDSVSVERWRDIWLNEGFATYFEARYREARGGPSTDRWLHRTYRDRLRYDEFWQVDLTDPGPHDLFHTAVYQRGAMALAALRNVIGKRDFRRLLRVWVAEHRDGNAEVADFRSLAEAESGEDLDRFFEVWLSREAPPPRRAAYGL